jgi:hypothetical protein
METVMGKRVRCCREEVGMSRYYTLHTQLSNLKKQRQATNQERQSARKEKGRPVTVWGILILAVALTNGMFLLLGLREPACVAAAAPLLIIGGGVLTVGIVLGSKGRRRVIELDSSIAEVQTEIESLRTKREGLLDSVRSGNMSALTSLADCTFQKLPISLLPAQRDLSFRPQKGETCFAQIPKVQLGRVRQRTATRTVGGGYHTAGVYIPVVKERTQRFEMDIIDTGTMAITNHRVLYLGTARKLTYRYDKILELTTRKDALSITKEGRRSADNYLKVDGVLLAAILAGINASR